MPMPSVEEATKWIIEDKKSMNSLAKHVECNVGALSAFLKKHGIVSVHIDNAKLKELDGQLLLERYENGSSLHKLHVEFKRPVRAIKNAILKANPSINFRSRDEALRPSDLNNPDILEKYAQSGKTMKQIASELDVKEATVIAAYKRLNLERFKRPDAVIIPKAELIKLYEQDKLSTIKIAVIYGTNANRVWKLLKEYEITLRLSASERDSKYPELNDISWLYAEYVVNKLTMSEVANLVGCRVGCVSHALQKAKIPLRSKEEIYDDLQDSSHGNRQIKHLHGLEISVDSELESEFVDFANVNAIQVSRGTMTLKYANAIYRPDFVSEDTVIEVKPNQQTRANGHDRAELIRQFLIANKNGYKFKTWDRDFHDLTLPDVSDQDKYYCLHWPLIFDSAQECYEWLVMHGFQGALRSRRLLLTGLSKYRKIIADRVTSDELFNSIFPANEVIWFMRHFHQHYFESYRSDGYKSISGAFKLGNQIVLREAVNKLWSKTNGINIYHLIESISRHFVDFTMLSMFKPWVARGVYTSLLPQGGTIVDPCAGWGGRLLGCFDLPVEYTGFDLNPLSVSGNQSMAKYVGKRHLPNVNVMEGDSSIVEFPKSDLIFTSPPYFGLEVYNGTPGVDKTGEIIDNIFKQRSSKVVALNVANNMVDRTVKSAETFGYSLNQTLVMNNRQFMLVRQKATEPILVFNMK